MIKDSKLIGTKIKAPFGWKKFKVGELFDKQGPITDRSVADFSIPYSEAYRGVNYINCATAGVDNNGCPMIVLRDVVDESYIINNCITVSANGVNTGSVFVQTEDFCVLQDAYALIFKHVDVDVDDYLFIASLISKYHDVFDYQVKATWTRLSELSIELPVTSDNQPDFEWMSEYIKVVKADYLEQKALSNRNEIEAYLSAGNTDSTDITDDDRQFLRDFAKLPRRKFKVGELFVPINPKRYDLKISDIIDNNGNTTVISSTTVNQGIKGYSSMAPLVKANKIVYSDAVGPSMMFYQECDFIADAHVKYLKPKFTVNMSKNTALYLITCIQKSTFGVYNYGNKYNNDAVNNTMVELPVIDSSQVDVGSIEKYMQIQSKPLIDNVAETLVPVRGGATLIDFAAIERYMQIQIKLTIGKHAKYLDKELALMKTV